MIEMAPLGERIGTLAAGICIGLIGLKVLFELWLEHLNQGHVSARAAAIPEALSETMDRATYGRAIEYTLAKSRFAQRETVYGALVLMVVLFSGVLPWSYGAFAAAWGATIWAQAAYFMAVTLGLSILFMPVSWRAQFGLEERFGFNTMSPRLWWMDRLKGLALSLMIGYPVLLFVLYSIAKAGSLWWLWAGAGLITLQFLLWVAAPIWILPLFNKFSPLPDDELRRRLLALAERLGVHARSVQVMDGSKRSRHSNAFLTGFGRFRRIVFFDTLLEQLNARELEAVLAHELGHHRLHHLPKIFLASALGLLAGLYAAAWLARQAWFYGAFGFESEHLMIALLLFFLLSGVLTFWFSPVTNFWSRRYEYQADGFARSAMGEADSLIGALRKLAARNLSNLTPHPWYSRFHYSHPTLLEREKALRAR